jgi:hypothetical protein
MLYPQTCKIKLDSDAPNHSKLIESSLKEHIVMFSIICGYSVEVIEIIEVVFLYSIGYVVRVGYTVEYVIACSRACLINCLLYKLATHELALLVSPYS